MPARRPKTGVGPPWKIRTLQGRHARQTGSTEDRARIPNRGAVHRSRLEVHRDEIHSGGSSTDEQPRRQRRFRLPLICCSEKSLSFRIPLLPRPLRVFALPCPFLPLSLGISTKCGTGWFPH